MIPYQITIPAGQAIEIAVGRGADYVFIEEAAAPIRVQDTTADQDVILKQGRAAKLQPFNNLRLSHESGSSVDVVIYVGRGTEIYASDVSGAVGISNAGTISDLGPVAVGDVAAALTSQDKDRRLIHVRNVGPSTIKLGSSSVTWAGGVIELIAGAEWREEAAAAAAWYAITDTAGAATVAILEGK